MGDRGPAGDGAWGAGVEVIVENLKPGRVSICCQHVWQGGGRHGGQGQLEKREEGLSRGPVGTMAVVGQVRLESVAEGKRAQGKGRVGEQEECVQRWWQVSSGLESLNVQVVIPGDIRAAV